MTNETTAPVQSLHDQIMRLPCDPAEYTNVNMMLAYKEGHRDARHAAAELAAAYEADAQQAAPVAVPTAWSEAQVRDFLSIALRHVEIVGSHLLYSDINDGLRYMAEKGQPAFVQAAPTPPAQQPSPIGKVLSEDEMAPGYDRRMGRIVWFGTPAPGLIYAAPPAQQSQTALKVLRDACEEALAWFESRTQGIAIDAKDTLRMALAEVRSNTAAPEQAEHPHQVNRSVIRDVFLRNGFTIKEGHADLKPYVYAAAEELLALDGKEIAAEQDAVTVPRELLQEAADELAFQDQQWLNEDAMGLRTTPPRVSRLLGKLRALLGGGA